jgi:hypothetical protein
MKKILVLLAAMALVNFSFAQAVFGLKGGANLASIGGDASGIEAKLGFHVGMFGLIKTTEKFAVQPELVFSRQGAQLAANSEIKIHYDYVNLPVMMNFYASEKFFLQAGPQIGILVGAKAKYKGDSEDLKDQLKGVDLGLGLGAGVETEKMLIGLRYNLGLTSTSKSSEGSFPNRVFQLSVGFKINNF